MYRNILYGGMVADFGTHNQVHTIVTIKLDESRICGPPEYAW